MRSPPGPASKSEPRIVVAFDLDCFYAQVVTVNSPELAGKPVAVRQKYITVTCNYEARKYGITKLCNLEEAKKRCPELVIVDGSDLTPFRLASEQICNFWREKAHGCPIERKGFDECCLDLTKIVLFRLRSINGPISFQGHVHGDLAAETRKDEELVRMLAVASLIVKEWREELLKVLGYKCCAGISVGKLSAKFAAEMKKPNSQSIILPSSFPDYVASIPCKKLQGIGRTMYKKLLHTYAVVHPEFAPNAGAKDGKTLQLLCSHVREMNYDLLLRVFDSKCKLATFVYNAVRGIDIESVSASSTFAKTVSQEETSLPHPTNWKDASSRLKLLCSRVLPMVKNRRDKTNELPCTIRVTILNKIKFGNIEMDKSQSQRDRKWPRSESRQRKVLSSHVVFSNVETMYKVAMPLLQDLLGGPGSRNLFRLARINLAVADFTRCSSKSKHATLHRSFFHSSSSNALKFNREDELAKRPELKSIESECNKSKKPISCFNSSRNTKSKLLVDPKDVDMSVLEELPPEIRNEIMNQICNYDNLQTSPSKKKKRQRIDSLFKQIAKKAK
mmetsp:Transcript_1772/g.2664  ORF Transcript_1772/g.2664 Transcript_1772/m.2664 type:complete len:561 (-) Transcript_1772:1491-3173(-)|eukprot:CAMPEP_0204837670 /NCGR_PEP_ID=MMETSP1346-20131115/28620_1 /ASSEMBLY_ACC=CAM_ASM_000771 /TAXON_ID=215587 /ORGANISM="Aplanochytrium stocchinoi, Strain GSBS06" /LENGTH=560 /DNA_ID=CAMNT_0051973263 /DNA_START=203 /DNA_END=1885 /DNA_ORIENTATION=-